MSETDVMIADDDRDLCEAIALRCRSLKLQVMVVHDAMQALTEVDRLRPRLIILDVNMPAGNGLSVCEMMARHEKLSEIPVIIMTGAPDPDTIRRCHQLCAYYVPKGGDVWSRIEPLIHDLLGAGPRDDSEKPAPASKPLDAAQAAPAAERCDADRVFAVLGWNHEYLDESTPAPAQDRAPEPSPGPWVLSIDDDSAMSFALKLRLEKEGVGLLRAFAGIEGFRSAFMGEAQAIILDYEMPDGRGDYVLHRLKDNPCTRDIPVIVLTGHRAMSLTRTMHNLGAVCVLTKPCPWETLWAELRKYLPATVPTASAGGA